MKNGMIIVASVFAIALAYVIGNRLSNEALAVVVGAVCGISASIPVSLGLLIAMSNNWGKQEMPARQAPGYNYPVQRFVPPQPQQQILPPQQPVIIFAPPQNVGPYGVPLPYNFQAPPYLLPPNAPTPGAPRDFKIIGDE